MKNLASAVAVLLLLACPPTSSKDADVARASKAKQALLVVQLAAADSIPASDLAVKARLEAAGFQVRMVDHAEPATAATGRDLVLISSSVSANKLEGRYRDVSIPIVVWESYALPHMGMSGRREETDFGTREKERYLWMVNAPHALSAGLPAGMLNVYAKGAGMNWGKPGLGATIIATISGQPDHVAEFAYEKGATMDYESIAPARRVFLFLDSATFPNLNDAGLKLFDAAVTWAVGDSAKQ